MDNRVWIFDNKETKSSGGSVLKWDDERFFTLTFNGKDFFGEIVFDTVIPRDVTVSEAPSHALSVLDYAPRSHGARAYTELCMEVRDCE